MSTQPTTPSLDDLRAAAVAAEVPPVTTPTPEVVAPVVNPNDPVINKTADGKFELVTPTGNRYVGNTEGEIALAVARGKIEADRTIQTLRQPPAPVDPAPPQIDPAIAQARSYLLDELAQSLGLPDGATLVNKFQTLDTVATSSTQDQIAAGFYQLCPDFPTNPQNVEILTGIAESNGLPETPQGLRAAHLLALADGKYKPLTQQEIQAQRMQALGISPQTVMPPTPAPLLPGQAPNANTDAFNPYDKKNTLEEVKRWAMGNQ